MATKKKTGKIAYSEPKGYFPKSALDILNGKTPKKSGTKKTGTTKKKK